MTANLLHYSEKRGSALLLGGVTRSERTEDDVAAKRWPVVMSTATPDRADDVVDQSAWKLGAYNTNPVLMMAHDYGRFPLGRVEGVTVESTANGGKLRGSLVFDQNPEHTDARIAERQWEQQILNTVSVGFRPGKVVPRASLPREDPRHGERGFVFMENELLELSIAPIPMNSEAARETAERILRTFDGELGRFAELRALVERAVRAEMSEELTARILEVLRSDAAAAAVTEAVFAYSPGSSEPAPDPDSVSWSDSTPLDSIP